MNVAALPSLSAHTLTSNAARAAIRVNQRPLIAEQPLPATVDLGSTADLFEAVDQVLDLSTPGRNVIARYRELAPADQRSFLQVLSTLLRQSVIGTETAERRGEPYTYHVDAGAGAAYGPGARYREDAAGSTLDAYA